MMNRKERRTLAAQTRPPATSQCACCVGAKQRHPTETPPARHEEAELHAGPGEFRATYNVATPQPAAQDTPAASAASSSA